MPANKKISEVVEQATKIGVDADIERLGADIARLRNLNLYGLKGVCAYAHHAHALGYRSDETDAGIENGLAFLGAGPTEATHLLGQALNWQRQLPGDGDAGRRQHRQFRRSGAHPGPGHPGCRQGHPGLRPRPA